VTVLGFTLLGGGVGEAQDPRFSGQRERVGMGASAVSMGMDRTVFPRGGV